MGSGDGVPLGRTMKMGPVLLAVGVALASGSGVISGDPVGIGVGGMIWPGKGGGTFGIWSGVGVGVGAAVAVATGDAAGSGVAPPD
jgi:hypothetical protein